MFKDCPECGKTNPTGFQVCECGHRFDPAPTRVDPEETSKSANPLLIALVVFWTLFRVGSVLLQLGDVLDLPVGTRGAALGMAAWIAAEQWALVLVGVAAAIYICRPKPTP